MALLHNLWKTLPFKTDYYKIFYDYFEVLKILKEGGLDE